MILLFPRLATLRKYPCSLSWVHEKLGLEKKSSHTANFTLFLYKNFKVLINDGDSEQNSSSRANRPKEVCQHREGTNTEPTKGSSCRDVPVKHEMRIEKGPLEFAQDGNKKVNGRILSSLVGLQSKVRNCNSAYHEIWKPRDINPCPPLHLGDLSNYLF